MVKKQLSRASCTQPAARAELRKRKLTGFIIPRQDEFRRIRGSLRRAAALADRLCRFVGLAILTLNKGAISSMAATPFSAGPGRYKIFTPASRR
jgi:hypothetical protein